MKRETFNICVDDDNVDILDWIHSHFQNGNWDKIFEVTITLQEIEYAENDEIVYVVPSELDECKTRN